MTDALVPELLTGVPLPLVLIDHNERLRHLNPPARRMFGDNMEGRHFLAVMRHPDTIDAVIQAFRHGKTVQSRYSRKDHSTETIFRVTCTPVGAQQPHPVLVSFEDMTPLETAGQMRRDFVANVSHELRTPLTAILGFIETLRGPARDDAAARDRFLEIMEREASRMNRLVDDLLSLSRVETEERIRPTELQVLPDLVQSVCHGLRPLADDGNVRLVILPSEDTPMVRGDADQLRQVFTNLIENAIKYGGRNGTVEITYKVIDRDPNLGTRALAVVVSDNGPGIEAIHLHRLTERFYRADSHRSQALGGTGLGLAIVKHILNRHRGRLKVESTVGLGSRFTAILPVQK
ncbi:MAG: two-component sensor histidine kinase [Rhodobacteraceae bacterium]|nr:two-component sensor histidine kinase [Paracoccaceae bacterium]